MSYKIKGHILGFEEITEVELFEIDEMFSTIIDKEKRGISFTLVNPYLLREYSFDLPSDLKVLLDVKVGSNVHVYNIVVIQEPLEDSKINFLAPIIINKDNNTIAQAVLNPKRHPDFGMSESIKSFKE